MDKCRAKDCGNEVPADGDLVCDQCLELLDRLLSDGLSKRIGRPATEDDVRQLWANIEARHPRWQLWVNTETKRPQ